MLPTLAFLTAITSAATTLTPATEPLLPYSQPGLQSSAQQTDFREPQQQGDNPLENIGITLDSGSLVEGDVRMVQTATSWLERMLDGSSYESPTVSNPQGHRSGVISEKDLWDANIVPYVLDQTLNGTEVHRIMDAMETIVSSTGKCVEFVPRTTEPDFVYITAREKGCWSDIGRKGGNQTVSVSRISGCVTSGIVMHELMHALGFGHEHTRPDRDQYIRILTRNVLFGHLSDFRIRNRKILVPEYDYYSLMHYKTTAFSKDVSRLRTIGIVQSGVDESSVGQRESLSDKDILRIKLLYGCEQS